MRLGGLISGADTETLISALLELERVRIYRQEEKQEQLEAKQKAWRDVRSALTNIQSKLDQLRFPTLFRSRKVELSDNSVATVTADAGAAQTSYTLQVVKLAQSHVITTQSEAAYKAADEQLGWAGTFDIGTDPNALKTITVEETDTLSSLAAKINAADSGVLAHVVMVSEGKFRLVLTAAKSGSANVIRLENEVPGQPPQGQTYGNLLEDILGLTGANQLVLSEAQDAEIILNGEPYKSSTNTFDNILPGIKITVKKPSGDDVVSMTVSSDIDKIVQVVKDWVNAVNSLQDLLKKLSAYDVEKKTGAALTGESLVRSIQSRMRQFFSTEVAGMPASMKMLSQIGVSTGAYGTADFGKIVVDEEKLREVLQRDPEGVARLFGLNEDGQKGIAVQMNDYIKSLLDSQSGALEVRDKSLSQQIDRIRDTIERIEVQLEQREKVLRLQFARMEEAMARLQGQGNYLALMLLGRSQSQS
ncbi:flagellar filament capping protein FliD [Symbiobacterium thermophilum]|nr:flagellar filament capping protein FliD [Symbiobacterium thermophilum]